MFPLGLFRALVWLILSCVALSTGLWKRRVGKMRRGNDGGTKFKEVFNDDAVGCIQLGQSPRGIL